MGEVWLAEDHQLQESGVPTQVALKFLAPSIRDYPRALQNLRSEVLKGRWLKHPNIVSIFDWSQWPGEPVFVAMEFVDGKTLDELLSQARRGFFQWSDLRPLAKQICDAVRYAHEEQRLLHCDIKPRNIMVTGLDIKLSDFGIAQPLALARRMGVGLRGAGGTPAYMSPQQARGEEPTVADDIYSLGAMFYELLTGEPPLFNDAPGGGVRLVSMEEQWRARGHSDVTPDVRETIEQCLDHDPTRRPRSVFELAVHLGLEGKPKSPPAVGPWIIQPPVNQTVERGHGATFTVLATGTEPLSYQWQFNGKELTGVAGATCPLTNVGLPQAGEYRVVVTNQAGSVISPTARLTVTRTRRPFAARLATWAALAGLAVVVAGAAWWYFKSPKAWLEITEPPRNRSVSQGGRTEFTVGVSGTPPLSYQWQSNGNPLPGATNATLILANVLPSQAGEYRVEVRNRAGVALSQPATLTVLSNSAGYVTGLPPKLVVQPVELPKPPTNQPPRSPPIPVKGKPWINSLGMVFLPLRSSNILLCAWETRRQDFRAFCEATEAERGGKGAWQDKPIPDRLEKPSEAEPIANMSWQQAEAFCAWLTEKERAMTTNGIGMSQRYRLPTVAEWRSALDLTPLPPGARARGVTNYLWGTNWPPPNNVANLAGSERAKERNPDRVGRYIREYRDFSPYTASPAPFSTNAAWFKANAAGFHHLIGNVWEMCKEGTNNIVGLGASWRTGEPEKSRYDYMNKAPGLGELDLGFRCALELGEENAQ